MNNHDLLPVSDEAVITDEMGNHARLHPSIQQALKTVGQAWVWLTGHQTYVELSLNDWMDHYPCEYVVDWPRRTLELRYESTDLDENYTLTLNLNDTPARMVVGHIINWSAIVEGGF